MKPTVYEKAKLLDGMSQQEWNELKRLIDEAFEQKEKRALARCQALCGHIVQNI